MKRYKELKYDGKLYTEQYKIDEILIENNFNWFLDCEVENVKLEIEYNTLIFNAGVFFNGTWIYGVFRDGEWKYGTWESGVWYNGIWRNGIFKNGLIFNGRFFNGKIENGTIKGGEFFKVNINETVIREDKYKKHKEDIVIMEPEPLVEGFFDFLKKKKHNSIEKKQNKIKSEKIPKSDIVSDINVFNDIDIFDEEEDWDGVYSIDKLYLSKKQSLVYDSSGEEYVDWKMKFYVLVKKNNSYYRIGCYRVMGNNFNKDYKMFYVDYKHIENENLIKYDGLIKGELNNKDFYKIIKELNKSKKLTYNLMDDTISYFDLIIMFLNKKNK